MFNKFKSKVSPKSKVQLVKFSPIEFREAKTIVAELTDNNVILVDLSNISRTESIRLIDFVSGALSVLGGKYKKVAPKTYLLSPSVELLDSFDNELIIED